MRSRYILIALVLVILAFGVGRLSAAVGTLDSPDVPENTQSFTLEDIYNRLDTGAEDGPSAFTEPAAGPGTETMHDLNDIMAEALVKDNTNGATTADVLTTKTYWSRRTADWGHQTGTMPDNGAVTIVPTTTNQTIALGYHNGSGKVEGDADLVASKIVSDVVIFEVTGSAIAATGDATAANVLTGKTFSIASAAGIAGAMPNNGAVTIVPTTTNKTIALGYHNGSGEVLGDTDLVSGNIKSGVDIFGVTGSYAGTICTGDATTAHVLKGKTFSNSSSTGLTGELYGGCTCTGTITPTGGTRWCDNGNGTVTDLLGYNGKGKCLVWLRKANWGGTKPWRRLVADATYCANAHNYICYDDAHAWAGRLKSGASGADLSDGSGSGVWRLPTKDELHGITEGTDPVSATSMQAFTDVQPYNDTDGRYWSSNTHDGTGGSIAMAWCVDMTYGVADWVHKSTHFYVWPVRGP